MNVNLNLISHILSNKAIPGYTLEKETGVSRNTISELRNGNVEFTNMRLSTILKVHEWAVENYTISYDYEELLDKFKADIQEGLIGKKILIERRETEDGLYNAIIDWYCEVEQVPHNVKVVELCNTEDIVKELNDMNRLI